MGHPDFRSGGRIFASMQPDRGIAVVKLTPGQQAEAVAADPQIFVPQAGAWGRQGWTAVVLDQADEERAGAALTLAWQNLDTARRSRSTRRPAGGDGSRTPRRVRRR